MDNRTLAAFMVGIVYPAMILGGVILFIFVYAYFLPDKGRQSKRIEHRIRK